MSNCLIVVPDFETMSQRAADAILEAVRHTPSLLICAATGATPTRTYGLLAAHCALFSQVRLIKLDEWCGLKADDPGSCEAYLLQHLVHPLSISADRYFGFKNDSTDHQTECERIANVLVQQGPIDLAIVGIGINGHIGFNEPQNANGEAMVEHAHRAELAIETRRHAMLQRSKVAFPQETIRYGLTLGMGDLLQAKQLIILASGTTKQRPVRRMLDSLSTEPSTPASYLWQRHINAMCICDQAAMPS